MAALANLKSEERVGLGIAVAAHVALFAALMLQPSKRDAVPTPERMTVSLADEVSLESTAPDPSAEPVAAVAPELAPEPAPPVEAAPRPAIERPVQREVAPPPPRTNPRTPPKPQPPKAVTPKPAAPKPAVAPEPKPAGSRIGADFLPGEAAGTAQTQDRGTPAARFGAAEQASLSQAINRQLKPHWAAPSGPDSEQLVTILAFNLNEDGTLAGSPRVVRQEGVNPTNQAQASRHAEQAIRAVRLAAPFDLPPQFYDKWKRISAWRFDRRL